MTTTMQDVDRLVSQVFAEIASGKLAFETVLASLPLVQEAALLASDQDDPWPLRVALGPVVYEALDLELLCDALDELGIEEVPA